MAGVDDPVAQKLVASLARPGRNVTGVASARRELGGKLMSLIRELGPGASRVTVLWDSADPDHRVILGDLRAAAKAVNLTLNDVEVQGYMDVEPAIVSIKRQGSKVLVVPSSTMFVPRWIADLALTHGLALASTSPGYVYEGGLIGYTDDWNAVYERVASFVDRILKGAKPADLPVELPAKFRLIVNKKTAQALKLTLPQSILLQADAVIE
jgi:putative ABC transport system substrate-binding protein